MKSKERKSNSEPSADSGLDLETKFFLGHAQRRSFSVDIPSYRTTYLTVRRIERIAGVHPFESQRNLIGTVVSRLQLCLAPRMSGVKRCGDGQNRKRDSTFYSAKQSAQFGF